MSKPQSSSARLRLQELLAIPDRLRTEAEWDELNQLEIMLAPGNREGAPGEGARRNGAPAPRHPQQPGGGPHGQKPQKKFHRRSPKGKGR